MNEARYKCWKSGGEDRLLFLMMFEDAPDKDVPDPIRHCGPWQGHREGQVADLQPHLRELLQRQRFVVLRPARLLEFEVENPLPDGTYRR